MAPKNTLKNNTARPRASFPVAQSDPARSAAQRVARRRPEPANADPDHHLWRNGRLWWVAFTVIHDGWRQERVRVSLQTDNVDTARRRRDDLLRLVEEAGECKIALRFVPRGTKHARQRGGRKGRRKAAARQDATRS
ncbi:MAG: hypothetical protein JRH16_23890 [Deltaproteobacteria bacterium]|nr:hypothetical protein [Deltaproteobacteria bacterium]